jgi:hypothetical protein
MPDATTMDRNSRPPLRSLIDDGQEEELYSSAPQNPEDIIWAGSDTEETPEELRQKRRRYERSARSYLCGHRPVILSASLRGPLEAGSGWVNPWRYAPKKDSDWWKPGSEDMLFTRENVMKRAQDYGLGYMTPSEALAWCKAAAKAEIGDRMKINQDNNILAEGGGTPRTRIDDSESMEAVAGEEEQDTDNWNEQSYMSNFANLQPDSGPDASIASGIQLLSDKSATAHEFLSRPKSLQLNVKRTRPKTRKAKRIADLEWLKGSYVSKRAKWNSPPVSSPTPLTSAKEEICRGSKETARSPDLEQGQVSSNPYSTASWAHHAPQRPATSSFVEIASQESGSKDDRIEILQANDGLNDLDEGSRETTVDPRSGFSSKSRGKAKGNLIANYCHSSLKPEGLGPRPKSFSTPNSNAFSSRKNCGLDSVDQPSSLRTTIKVELPEDYSFITEVAPSSRGVEEFQFRKRRKKSSAEHGFDSIERPFGYIPHMPRSRSKSTTIAIEADEGSTISMLPSIRKTTPTQAEERERLRVCAAPVIVDFEPPEEIPFNSNIDITSAPSADSVQSAKFQDTWETVDQQDAGLGDEPSNTTPLSPNNYMSLAHEKTMKPNEFDESWETVEEKQETNLDHQEYRGSETPANLHNDGVMYTEIHYKDRVESIGIPPIYEDSHELGAEATEDGMDMIQQALSQCLPGTNSTHSVEPSGAVQLEENTVDHEADGVSVNSRRDCSPQSPWAAEVPPFGCSTSCGNVGTASEDEAHLLLQVHTRGDLPVIEFQSISQNHGEESSGWQPTDRPMTPDYEGCKPFRELMSPTPPPERITACIYEHEGTGLDTQMLIEIATSNPWSSSFKKHGSGKRKPKKRVSWGDISEEDKDGSDLSSSKQHPGSPPPPTPVEREGEEDIDDAITVAKKFQKHFSVAGFKRRLPKKKSPLPASSPAVGAMAEAFIAADQEISALRKRQQPALDQTPSRHLKPKSDSMTNISSQGSSNGSFRASSPVRATAAPTRTIDYDMGNELLDLLDEAGDLLEDWSVEAELKKANTGDGHRKQQKAGTRTRLAWGFE